MKHLPGLALATSLLASGLLAQAAPPATVIPAAPLVVAHVDGPGALRAAFLPTNMGKMLSGPEFKQLAAPLLAMLDMLRAQGANLPFDLKAVEKGLMEYRGRLSVSAHLHGTKIDPRGPEETPWTLALILTPDGKTPLKTLAEQANTMVLGMMGSEPGEPGPVSQVKVGETVVQVISQGSDPAVCLPFMHKGHLVALLSTSPKQGIEAFLGDGPRHPNQHRAARSSMGIWVNAARVVEIIKANGPMMAGPAWDAVGGAILAHTGVESLTALELCMAARGPYLTQEAAIHFNDKPRGYLACLAPAQGGHSKLDWVLPANAIQAVHMPFDLRPAYHTTARLLGALGEGVPASMAELEAAFEKETGVRLKADLVDQLGSGLAVFQTGARGGFDPANPMSMYDGMVIAFGLAEGAKLAPTLKTMLQKLGAGIELQTSKTGDFEIHSIDLMMMVQLHFVATDKLLALGVGEAGKANLSRLTAPKPRGELPVQVQQRLANIPGPHQGRGWYDLKAQLVGYLDIFDIIADEWPPELEPLLAIAEEMPALMTKYKIGHIAEVAKQGKNSIRFVRIW